MQAPLLRQWAARLAPHLHDNPPLQSLYRQILAAAEKSEASVLSPEVAAPLPAEAPAPPPTPAAAPILCPGASIKLIVTEEGLLSADPSDALVQRLFDLACEEKVSALVGPIQVPVEIVLLNKEEEVEYLSRKDQGQ